ncbi:MAG: histidine phosphatase family protein [Proteobacteria bacterium]|nr:histidine phosphatase family protein [Pseudomonadota bacterium]
MRNLALVRHGETAWNAGHVLQGQMDIGLSENGRRQAAALRSAVAALEPVATIVSDLRRTRETAELLGLDGPHDPAWRETDLGAWTGRSKRDLLAEDAAAYRGWRNGTFDPPGGETWAAFRARVAAALAALPQQPGTIVVVTHGGVIRAALSILIGLPPDRIVPVDPASLTVFDVTDGARLKLYNTRGDVSLLDPPD